MIEKIYNLTAHPACQIFQPMLVALAVFLSALLIRRVLLRRLQRWAEQTVWEWDDIVFEGIKSPSFYWCLIAGLYTAVVALPLSSNWQQLFGKLFTVLWLISLTILALRVADQTIRRFGAKMGGTLPLTSLSQNLAKGAVFTIGFLMILTSLGVSITPLLTALGVGGLAVALALQDTLDNLFSGIYVSLAKQVRVGDYVKFDFGEEGRIIDIGWRSMRLRSNFNNWVIVPNTRVAKSVITNYDLESPEILIPVSFGVDYGSDLEKVERVTLEVARDLLKTVGGGVPDFEPVVRFSAFKDFSIEVTVVLRAKTFVDQSLLTHELIKRLHKAYAQQGIRIPFPTQMVIQQPSSPRE